MTTDPDHGELVPLGDGPVATVLAGVDATTGEAFALKVFPGKLDRHTRTALDNELARLSALREHDTVLVADRVEEYADGRCALRMELCTQSLPELLDAFGPLSVADTLVLGTVLSSALAAAHAAGLVHGGVTPGNVLFRPSGEPVLSDFGLTLRHAFPRDPLRTADFLPPETVRDGSADERSDLYGLGAVLYLALSGRPPHHGPPGEEPGERLLRVLVTPVPPLDRADVPPELALLVSALLAKDPDARPATAAVAEQLNLLRTADEPTPPPEPADPPGFDDFAPLSKVEPPPPAPQPPRPAIEAPPAAPRPRGEPILVLGAKPQRRHTARLVSILASVGALSLLATAAVLLRTRPGELTVPPASAQVAVSSAPTTPAKVVRLELADPADRGNFVELSWRSSEPLDFAVVFAAEGERPTVRLAQRNNTYRVDVDPVRRYCFLIQGTDGNQVYETEPKPIRGATCVK